MGGGGEMVMRWLGRIFERIARTEDEKQQMQMKKHVRCTTMILCLLLRYSSLTLSLSILFMKSLFRMIFVITKKKLHIQQRIPIYCGQERSSSRIFRFSVRRDIFSFC